MNIIEYHLGCNAYPNPGGCWGPSNNFYTIFDSELRFLTFHITLSVLFGLALFFFILFMNKKKKIRVSLYLNLVISIVLSIILFFVLAYFLPVMVNY